MNPQPLRELFEKETGRPADITISFIDEDYGKDRMLAPSPFYVTWLEQRLTAGAGKGEAIQYQCCPVCKGYGQVQPLYNIGASSAMYETCSVCNGAKIILPFIPESTPPCADKEIEAAALSDIEIEVEAENFANKNYPFAHRDKQVAFDSFEAGMKRYRSETAKGMDGK